MVSFRCEENRPIMKLITRDTDYAIRAVCFIAEEGKDIVSVGEMSRKLHIPRPFLRKILQVLNKNRLLRSYRGIGGGFSMAGRPESIYIVDIIRAFQGPLSLNECFLNKRICPNRKSCALKDRIDGIEKSVVSEMKKITIGDLIKK